MGGRIAAVAALAALAGCAGVEPVGRNATRAPTPVTQPAPAQSSAQPAPAPVQQAVPAPVAPPAQATPAPRTEAPVAAPTLAAPAAPRAAPREAGGGSDIVVRGAADRQIPPPQGDNRSAAQRNEDVRAWDQCVMVAQSAFESDPLRPQLDVPEDYCRRSLGMADRDAVPESRRQR